MDLSIIGAGPAFSDRLGASGAAYVVRVGGVRLLFDLGHGSFARLFRTLDPAVLDAVFVTHLHPDHFVDLVPMALYLRWQLVPAQRRLVYGPADLSSRLDDLHAEPGFTAAAFDCVPWGERVIRVGMATVESRLVAHTAESYALRAAGPTGPGLVYTGDCGRTDELSSLIRPGDTLLSEISFGAGPAIPGVAHLTGPAIGDLARERGVTRVLLTHLLMDRDPAAAIASVRAGYDGDVIMVSPGMDLRL